MPPVPLIQKHVPVVVVGTGISGLFTALKLASYGLKTLLVTKAALDDSNSRYAQGGIAAVLPNNADDSLALHLQDTIAAGAGLVDALAAQSILSEGYASIEDLLAYGVPFDRRPDASLALTREAAHSVDRILHAGGDATGHQVEMTLIDQTRKHAQIEVSEYTQVVELLMSEGQCQGCLAVNYRTGEVWEIHSPHVILATGGVGRLYSHTTNPAVATGDGISVACRAGADIANMEFIQFHPTAFYAEGNLHFLISEALRGEGGILRTIHGERFAHRYHPDGELGPRDIVTRAIYAEMRETRQPHVYLDITHLPSDTIERRFPTILANCQAFGVDIRTDWIPVAPAAHYLMGGISVDVHGESTLPGLYAVGEVAHTGLHGANRLASNSLLECLVLARRVSQLVSDRVGPSAPSLSIEQTPAPQVASAPAAYRFDCPEALERAQAHLRQVMWSRVGILRNQTDLEQALFEIQQLEARAMQAGWAHVVPAGVELDNQLVVARLIAEAALHRTESRGAHCRTDYPEVSKESLPPLGTILLEKEAI